MLINFRVDPQLLARQLPDPFRPQVVDGSAMVGICLIRLKQIRPNGFPEWLGIGSENAAHRAAVEWTEAGELRRGVFIWRRDTSSRLNALAGGRLFPGRHTRATFDVRENEDELSLAMRSRDGLAVDVAARVSGGWPGESVFADVSQASAFFQAGSTGYSPSRHDRRFDGMTLECETWDVHALQVERARSTFFEDTGRWPSGSVVFDNGLLMRKIAHRWKSQPNPVCGC